MLIINKSKPFYVDKKNKEIRMGNFKETGKQIEYEEDNIFSIFENLNAPISQNDLVDKVHRQTGVSKSEIINAIKFLISEGFIIKNEDYENILSEKQYNRQNLYFSMFSNDFVLRNNLIKNKKVLILGLGGIGANVALILSRAGFNYFILVDFDKVEESNLIRQLPYTFNDIGKYKTQCLYDKIKNSYNEVKIKNKTILSDKDIEAEVSEADLVICTLDKPRRKIRRIINAVCVKYKKPVLFCGFSEHVGMIGPFVIPSETACLKCIEKKMSEEPLNNVTVTPSFGPLCVLISSIVSNEIINYFVQYNKVSLKGKTMMFSFVTYESKIIEWKKDENCKECGKHDIKKC